MGDSMPSLKTVMRLLAGIAELKRLPPKNAEISGVAESDDITDFAVRDYRDCDGDCQPGVSALQRLPAKKVKISEDAESA